MLRDEDAKQRLLVDIHVSKKSDVYPTEILCLKQVIDHGPLHQFIFGMHGARIFGFDRVWTVLWVTWLFENFFYLFLNLKSPEVFSIDVDHLGDVGWEVLPQNLEVVAELNVIKVCDGWVCDVLENCHPFSVKALQI